MWICEAPPDYRNTRRRSRRQPVDACARATKSARSLLGAARCRSRRTTQARRQLWVASRDEKAEAALDRRVTCLAAVPVPELQILRANRIMVNRDEEITAARLFRACRQAADGAGKVDFLDLRAESPQCKRQPGGQITVELELASPARAKSARFGQGMTNIDGHPGRRGRDRPCTPCSRGRQQETGKNDR